MFIIAELFDLFPYMWLYTFSLVFFVCRLFDWISVDPRFEKGLCLLPFGVTVMDIIENVAAILITLQYPSIPSSLVVIHTIAVSLKWLLFILVIVVLACMPLAALLIACAFNKNQFIVLTIICSEFSPRKTHTKQS